MAPPHAVLYRLHQILRVEQRWIARHDRVDKRLAQRPESARRRQIGPQPTPAPRPALVHPHLQALTTQLVEDQPDVPHNCVTDDRRIGWTKGELLTFLH